MQGSGLVVDRLAPDGARGWRTTRPIPLDGDWKVFLRLQRGRAVLGAPVRLPRIRRSRRRRSRPRTARLARSTRTGRCCRRERKGDVPGWLWGGASTIVLVSACGFLGSLAWGLARVAPSARPAAALRATLYV